MPEISMEQFSEVDLRVARVLAAERIGGTDHLLSLSLDLGAETRRIVAGIGATYDPDDLNGKLIVIVANLAPAVIRGVESQGMLLAGGGRGRAVLICPEGPLAPGTRVQ